MYCSGFESKIRLKLLLIYWSPWLKTMPTLQSPSFTRKNVSSVSLETYVHQNSKACVNSKVCPKVAQEINWSKISRVVWQSIITSKIQSKIQFMIQSMHHIHEFTHHPIQTLIQDIFHDSFQDQSIIPSNIQSVVTPSKMQPMIQSKIQSIVQSKIQSMIQVSCSGVSEYDLTI